MKQRQKLLGVIFILFFCLFLQAFAFTTKEVTGTGPYPYNFHIIDDHVYAGGQPLNPATDFNNSDEQVLAILKYLKSLGVRSVVNLEDTKSIQNRYGKLLQKTELKQLHIPLSATHLPNRKDIYKLFYFLRKKSQ